MLKRLLPLALATFAVGTDGYVIAGLLPSIAADLGVSTPVAGQLVTVFALTMALSAPVMGALTGGLDRRSALLIAFSVFVIGNAVTALGTSYEVVMAARIVTAAGAGIITSAASSTAAAIAPPERRGRALAFVLGGLTLATALGLPLGTLIGRTDWHITLWVVAGIGLLAAVGIAVGLPRVMLPPPRCPTAFVHSSKGACWPCWRSPPSLSSASTPSTPTSPRLCGRLPAATSRY
ncbi:MFS transporter [Streptomyces sp. NPDC056308]|uniref:MFS transporter n=1 Tax=Streptomyces sp. NPDC056308 TaxID=3345780 RepID=UPI0035D988FE